MASEREGKVFVNKLGVANNIWTSSSNPVLLHISDITPR